ncbi:MAG: hypothetical protein P0119_22250 [Nitrospira sp.]|nr:hypothetical protein [Nitrospira sp.]
MSPTHEQTSWHRQSSDAAVPALESSVNRGVCRQDPYWEPGKGEDTCEKPLIQEFAKNLKQRKQPVAMHVSLRLLPGADADTLNVQPSRLFALP